MIYRCEKLYRQTTEYGIRILECRGLDSLAAIPASIYGLPVVELAPYIFSIHPDYGAKENKDTFWWSDDGELNAPSATAPDGLPALEGNRLEELRLPPYLAKVGAYAFYNCEQLRKLEVYSTTLDWGAGVFTGCYGITELTAYVDESRKSCLREILAEIRQTLDVTYLPVNHLGTVHGICARLILPEFFEEAVENTPARILVTETHGCGQKYRNAFVQTQFQFKEYDSLFPHVQVQEPETLVARLVLGRLMYPYKLEERYRKRYHEYLTEHAITAAAQAIEFGHMEQLEWLFGHATYDAAQTDCLLDIAGKVRNGSATSYLMDRKRAAGTIRRKRFSI